MTVKPLVRLLVVGLLFGAACKGDGDPRASAGPPSGGRAAAAAGDSAAAGVAPAPTPAPPVVANDNATPKAPPFLWEIRGPNGPTYLFGTMHMGVDLDRDVHPVVSEKATAAKTFVMEADDAGMDTGVVMQMATYPDGETLDQKLSKDQWQKLIVAMGGMFPEKNLRRLKPWFVMLTLVMQMVPLTAPMDVVLKGRAKEAGAEVAFLEDWKYQIEIIEQATTLADLVDLIDERERNERELEELIAAYRAGDLAAVEKLVFDPEKMKRSPKMFDLALTARNRAWIPALEQHAVRGHAFIAVGLAHLVGDEGVVTLLGKRGYQATRVVVAPTASEPSVPAGERKAN
jgi:uncharacterized protein YbaP (TraB family)